MATEHAPLVRIWIPIERRMHSDVRVDRRGEPYRVRRTVARDSTGGGWVHAEITPIHARSCAAWRIGKQHGPCSCGAEGLWARFLAAFGDDPWAGVSCGGVDPGTGR